MGTGHGWGQALALGLRAPVGEPLPMAVWRPPPSVEGQVMAGVHWLLPLMGGDEAVLVQAGGWLWPE